MHGKNSQKNKNRREFTNLINCIYKNPSANIFNGERWNAFPLRLVTTQGCLLSPLLFNIGGRPSQCNKARKGIKVGKEEVTLSLFADNMILYIENPKDATRKLLELINEFGKIAGYKINTQKSLAFLYTNQER